MFERMAGEPSVLKITVYVSHRHRDLWNQWQTDRVTTEAISS